MAGTFSSAPTGTPIRRSYHDYYYENSTYSCSGGSYLELIGQSTGCSSSRPSAISCRVSPTGVTASQSSEFSRYRGSVRPWISEQPTLLPWVMETDATIGWAPMDNNIGSMQYTTLHESEIEFRRIRSLFKDTTKKWFQIVEIQRVENHFLMAQYSLRKDEMRRLLHKPIEDALLFHGTKTEYVDEICRNNFNWRLHGYSTGNRFGRGVSFSPISYYASRYSSRGKYCVKKMIVARVIIGKCCIGHAEMRVPTSGCDTSMKEGGDVFVKYQDDEYYPAYVITYTAKFPRNNTSKYSDFQVY